MQLYGHRQKLFQASDCAFYILFNRNAIVESQVIVRHTEQSTYTHRHTSKCLAALLNSMAAVDDSELEGGQLTLEAFQERIHSTAGRFSLLLMLKGCSSVTGCLFRGRGGYLRWYEIFQTSPLSMCSQLYLDSSVCVY